MTLPAPPSPPAPPPLPDIEALKSSLPASAQKILSPSAPQKLKEMAARAIVPGARPADVISVLVALSASEPREIAEIARKTLGALPEPLLSGALAGDLHPAAAHALAERYIERVDAIQKVLAAPRVAIETVAMLARSGGEAVTELVATNEERMLANPRLIEILYMNPKTRASTADRLVDLAARSGVELTGIPAWREACAAIAGELIPEPSEEPTPDDVLFQETHAIAEQLKSASDEDTHVEPEPGREVVKERFIPLSKRLAQMTVSQKVRRAMVGSKEERMLLVRDKSRVVAAAVIRSPHMQEAEVVLISRNKNVSDEVLRAIAASPEWLKSYAVKKNLVENPRTPPILSARLVQHLRESDLRLIAKSKNVPSAVQEAARRHLHRRET